MKKLSRERLAASAVVLATLAASSFVESQVSRTKSGAGTQPAGRYSVTLRGLAAVPIADFSGGGAVGEVQIVRQGTSLMAKKHIGSISHLPIEIELPIAGRNPMTIWVEEMIRGSGPRRDGAIATFGAAGLDFSGGLIEEVSIPDMDAAISSPGRLFVKVMADQTRRTAGIGRVEPTITRGNKNWLTSNFKVSISGVDASRIRKIESFSIKQETVRHRAATGTERITRLVPGRMEIPNLVFYIPEANAQGFFDWHQDFVIRGNNGDAQEKNATIELLTATGEMLMQFSFGNVGIVSVSLAKAGAPVSGIRLVRVELYAERVEAKVS